MKALLLLALAQATPAPPAVEPWTGSLAEGLVEVERLADSGKRDEALALTERLLVPTKAAKWREEATSKPGWKRTAVDAAGPILDAFGLADLSDLERATIHHARGVLLAQTGDGRRLPGVEAFDRARSLAGPGDLRLDATYDAGWTWLAEGEALRAKIPEISGAAPPAAAPAGPPGAPGAGPPEPDPLALARTAYLQARGRFVERVQLDASDADTRANLELVQRRLRELAEIEKKREEEKKKQEDQKKDQEKKDSDQQKDKDEKSKDDEKKDDEHKPDEKPKPDEKKPDEKPKEEPPDPKDSEQPKEPKKDKNQKPSKEELLTREEVMRLLDILKNREEEGKKLLDQLRASRRVSVKKDW